MNNIKRTAAMLLAVAAILSLTACGGKKAEVPAETEDPHKGQVYIYDGNGYVWYTPVDGAEVNPLTKSDFDYVDDTPIYKGSVYDVKKGIDVSEHQLEIDWEQLKNEDLDYAYIRVGRRGYTEGGIFEDKYFERNLSGAQSIGLETGVYFFSQAINVSEAIEEANWVIDKIKDKNITLPVVFDWEEQKTDDSRTRGLDGKTVTDCAVAFCETIKNAYYVPCVYFYRIPGYYLYDISRLQQFTLWFALPCTPPEVTFPSFYYRINMWQYTNSAMLPGIPVECDLNYWFIPKEQS